MLTKYYKFDLLCVKLNFQIYSWIKRSLYSIVPLIFLFTALWHHKGMVMTYFLLCLSYNQVLYKYVFIINFGFRYKNLWQ